MATEVWEYTPSGGDWWNRYADDAPVTLNYSKRKMMGLRPADVVLFALVACVMLWFAHQSRAQHVQAAAVTTKPKFASFYNCQLPQPGIQPQQRDGDPTHTRFFPYNYTVCDGVQVTLWSAVR